MRPNPATAQRRAGGVAGSCRFSSLPRCALRSTGVRRALNVVLALVAVTLIAGAFVAGLRGGSIYNNFPLMGGQILPGEYAAQSPLWLNWWPMSRCRLGAQRRKCPLQAKLL